VNGNSGSGEAGAAPENATTLIPTMQNAAALRKRKLDAFGLSICASLPDFVRAHLGA